VIERLAPLTGGADEDFELCFDLRLTNVFIEAAWTDGALDGVFLALDRSADYPFCFFCLHHTNLQIAPWSARRINSSVECVPGPAALSKRVASAGL
jgi:hypothetical protein